MECYACSNEATRQCRRCARVYCEVHGGDLCAECLNPRSALPSFNLYRGSLLALLVGTAVALWLLVQPTSSGDEEEVAIVQFTPTTVVTEAAETPDADATPTPRGTSTPRANETPERTPREYEVQEGDTLTDIAERFAPVGVDPFDYAEEIAEASGLSDIEDPIQPGDTLTLP